MSEIVTHPHEGAANPYVCFTFDHDPTLVEVTEVGKTFATLLCGVLGLPSGSLVVPNVHVFDDSHPRTLCVKLPVEMAPVARSIQAMIDAEGLT